MNNIGKLTTFSRLMKEESVIMIPKVQRDYAYGRKEEKVEEVLDGLLTTMLNAVKENTNVILDFVYGGTFVKKNNESSGLIPLDGQQRLTTLFLLYYYASIVQPNVDDVEYLKKFRYETRQSATEFIEALVGSIRNDIIEAYTEDSKIKDLIEDNPKYLPSYSSDPTITSMLNVLEVIESKFREDPIDDLWMKLNEQDNIQFYSMSLDKFGLTDDLYIKMNSRGKKLTKFEIFKSDLEKRVNCVCPDLKDIISQRIDNDWMDLLWAYAQKTGNDSNYLMKADDGYMCLFNNIFRLEMFRRGIETQKKRNPSIEEIITDKDAITRIMSIFDMMSDIQKRPGGIDQFWQEHFCFSDDILGDDYLIRLFWQQSQNRKPVFYLAMDRDLSVPETVYFYAIYLLFYSNKNKETNMKCLRVVRNLVTANTNAHSARYDMLGGFMQDVKEIISQDGIISEGNHTFVSTACQEERVKAINFTPEEYSALLKYENHDYLQGSLMLFINKYKEHAELFKQLEHFVNIFNNQSSSYFDRIRINLVDKDVDYAQYNQSMEKDQNMTRRLFIHGKDDFLDFFIKNERRCNQDAILTIIANKFTSLDDLKNPDEKCKEFDITSWQYYMTKYPSANRESTTYGCYAWDDKDNKPLEMVILNSSYHSPYYIEWKMLNHILFYEVRDGSGNYGLDPHASSPFVMNKYGVTLSIMQNGWKMTCNNENVISSLEDNQLYSISLVPDEENTYMVDFKNDPIEMDYIDLAKNIIKDIESAFAVLGESN